MKFYSAVRPPSWNTLIGGPRELRNSHSCALFVRYEGATIVVAIEVTALMMLQRCMSLEVAHMCYCLIGER